MSDEDGAISSGGATCAPVPPRAQTQSISGLFLRVDPSCPLCVYVLRASEELSGTARDNGSSVAYYNPFLVPCKGANRSQALAKVVKAQTGQSATSLIEGRGGGAFEVITVPLPGSATAFNVFVVQIGPLNATHNSLTLATLEFSEHQKRMRALYDACGPARRVDTDLITALAVDKLASVPVVNLIAAADAVLKGARKVEILDYHDAVIPMRAEFLGALPLLRGALVKALTRFTAPAARGADARSIPESLGSPRVPVPQDMDTIGSFRHPRKGTELVISVGNFHAAHNLASLRAAGVTHIVNCFVSDLSPGHEFGLDGRALKCCAADPARNVGETCKPRHWTPFPDEFEYACVVRARTRARPRPPRTHVQHRPSPPHYDLFSTRLTVRRGDGFGVSGNRVIVASGVRARSRRVAIACVDARFIPLHGGCKPQCHDRLSIYDTARH